MSLINQFENAVQESKQLKEKSGNNVLLNLYAYYKQATTGDVLEEASTINPFDFVAKAKHNAWEGQRGKSKEAAMQEYIDLITELKAS